VTSGPAENSQFAKLSPQRRRLSEAAEPPRGRKSSSLRAGETTTIKSYLNPKVLSLYLLLYARIDLFLGDR
jgi:hypothetical protein